MTKCRSSSFFRILSVFLASIVVSSALFYLLAQADNKYASPASQPIGGVLILTEEELATYPLRFLIPASCSPLPILLPERLQLTGNSFQSANMEALRPEMPHAARMAAQLTGSHSTYHPRCAPTRLNCRKFIPPAGYT